MAVPQIPKAANERETLIAFLDFYRALVIDKASGLTTEQLNCRLEPSSLTLGGLVHHLAVVEHWWFHEAFSGGARLEPWASVDWEAAPDWEMEIVPTLPPDIIFERYRDAIARSNEVIAATPSLDDLSVRDRNGQHWSLRWILVHMIEETARHVGHADLIRESIDGSVGDFREAAD